MVFDSNFSVTIRELETGKWSVEMDEEPIRAFGTTKDDAYGKFIAVYELYKEYGENWMAAVLAGKSEEYADAHIEMNQNPWSPDGTQ